MARFFVSKDDIEDNVIRISDKDAFHIARSLRMAVGDSLTVCDEDGAEYLSKLTRIRDDECLAEIISKSAGVSSKSTPTPHASRSIYIVLSLIKHRTRQEGSVAKPQSAP